MFSYLVFSKSLSHLFQKKVSKFMYMFYQAWSIFLKFDISSEKVGILHAGVSYVDE